ncbi:hypothetical protein Ac2012v2_003481 [Leucoagaricus gongylophorus]
MFMCQWKTRSQSLSRPKPLSPKPPSRVSATGGLCDSKTWARFLPSGEPTTFPGLASTRTVTISAR